MSNTMSASMFSQTIPTNKTMEFNPYGASRIPIPSPTPLRRSGSLRIKGENERERRNSLLQTSQASVVAAPLKRGHSFMERDERRATSARAAVAARSCQEATTPTTTTTSNPKAAGVLSPHSPGNRNRSLSLSLSSARLSAPTSSISPRTPPTTPDGKLHKYHHQHQQDSCWDSESVSSSVSLASCDHATVAWNGTTFSGRSMKYVVHCNQHSGATGEDYLTPTQRAHRQVRLLKSLLQQAQKDLEQKDSDIVKLTKEVVELRLYKAALNSPEDKSNSSDAVTVKENTPDDVDGAAVATSNHLDTSSYADSGHYEDYANSSVHSKDSVHLSEDYSQSPYKVKASVETAEKSSLAQLGSKDYEIEYHRLVGEYEKKIQELVRTYEEDCYQIKQKHNDKIEELLQRLSEINSRYWQLVPELEQARERIKELEDQLEELGNKLEMQEKKHREVFLKFCEQQEASKSAESEKVMDIVPAAPRNRISVPELLHQLQVTQTELENIKAMYRQLMESKGSKNKIDPEITLQFLKSAIYYFLTDKDNTQGHLRAIQSILGFTPAEISNIEKSRLNQ